MMGIKKDSVLPDPVPVEMIREFPFNISLTAFS
jgi:hypothetical protein